MKVGFFSPLPPAPTGVADYSASLLKALRERLDIGVNAPGADLRLYHLGNNHLHREIYEEALRKPGVIVLHDAVLQHFLLGSLDHDSYVAEFIYNYGSWTADLARSLWRERAGSAADDRYFRYPMLKRIVENSLGVIVHNPAAARLVREHALEVDLCEIPHLFEPRAPAPLPDVERLRSRLGIPAGAFLFGVFGHLRESKRLAAILRSFTRARNQKPMALLIAGEFASSDLARSLEPELRRAGIIRVGYLPEADFWLHASAVDACINLRYPQAGESSGIAIRLMGTGKPVVVSAGCESAGFPEAACIRVENGPDEEAMLCGIMLWLSAYPGDARAIGERAAAHIREFHAVDRVATLYQKYLTACYYRNT